MNIPVQKVESLTVSDLKRSPVWRYSDDDEFRETGVLPIKHFPVKDLTGKLIGTRVRLANGDSVWSLIGNVDNNSHRLNGHLLTISIERDGKWFTLARYHDLNYDRNGPSALADFLKLDVDQVFPISYDLRSYAVGNADALVGNILKEPSERLTRAQVVALVVP